MAIKFSQIRKLRKFCEDLHSEPDWKEVLEKVLDDDSDFRVSDVRFIGESSIDEIQRDEMSGDLYMLGCFNADFLSAYLPIDSDDIKAIQETGKYEIVGKMALEHIEEIQQGYAGADGYGAHFNSYDGGEEYITIELADGERRSYLVFDNH